MRTGEAMARRVVATILAVMTVTGCTWSRHAVTPEDLGVTPAREVRVHRRAGDTICLDRAEIRNDSVVGVWGATVRGVPLTQVERLDRPCRVTGPVVAVLGVGLALGIVVLALQGVQNVGSGGFGLGG